MSLQESSRGLVKQVEQRPEDGFDAAALGRGEHRGDLEVGEIEQGVPDARELSLDGVGHGGQGGRRIRLELALRVGQEPFLVARVRDTKCTE